MKLSVQVARRLLLAALVLAVWWAASSRVPSFVLPGPYAVLQAFSSLLHTPTFLQDVGATLARVGIGFFLAAAAGTALGVVMGASRALADFLEPVVAVFNTVSSAIWAVFAIIWFGLSDASTVMVVFMTTMPLMLTSVWNGTKTVDKQYVELAKSFNLSRLQILAKIYVPTVLPSFFAGARLAFGFGWRVSLVAETIGASSGIGYRLRQAADLIQSSQVFAWTILLIMFMLLIEAGVLKPLENALFRWKPSPE
ncbi:MAG: ABC transporter permease [Desulfovibrio sp.]|jgi:NitT/TauT family transport system permease protein|nr:ABC transporter permease [Desulfovibrio sp.]